MTGIVHADHTRLFALYLISFYPDHPPAADTIAIPRLLTSSQINLHSQYKITFGGDDISRFPSIFLILYT